MAKENGILFLGVKKPGVIALRTLLQEGGAPAAVITRAGRENRPIVELARRNGLRVFTDPPLRTKRFMRKLKLLRVSVALNFSYPEIFRQDFIGIFPNGCINFHPAILPRYRGRYPTVWPILYGDRFAGYTMHYIDRGIDTGDIIDIARIGIGDGDTGYSLYNKMTRLIPVLLKRYLFRVAAKRVPATPQIKGTSRYFSRLPNNGEIDWERKAPEIQRFIRALRHPYFECAFVRRGGKKIEILDTYLPRRGKEYACHRPGELVFQGAGVFAVCRGGSVGIKRIRVGNKELAKKKTLRYLKKLSMVEEER